MPKPPEQVEVPYALKREELKDLTNGEIALLLAESDAFRAEFGPIFEAIDAERKDNRGPDPLYISFECELVLIYQWVCGLESYSAARERLSSDRGKADRILFGMDKPRTRPGEGPHDRTNGIPSEASISRHRKRLSRRRRWGAYERTLNKLVEKHLREFPEMQEEARLLSMDGSKLETHYTCPIYNDAREIVNPDAITCHDGGYIGQGGGTGKSGHGYNLVSIVTLTGLPLAGAIVPIHFAECNTAIRLVKERVQPMVSPHFDPTLKRVVIADGAFNKRELRIELRNAGLSEQIHSVSHAKRETSSNNAKKHDDDVWLINGYENWVSNGHYELRCRCGEGTISRRHRNTARGVVIGTEGKCNNCGPISITAGRWRKVTNHKKTGQTAFVRCQPDELDEADQAFGNSLTYNDRLSKIYGWKRFGHGEGFHGSLVTRFGLLKGKSWIRRADEAKTAVAIVFSIMHVVAMEQRKRVAAALAIDPPGDSPPS